MDRFLLAENPLKNREANSDVHYIIGTEYPRCIIGMIYLDINNYYQDLSSLFGQFQYSDNMDTSEHCRLVVRKYFDHSVGEIISREESKNYNSMLVDAWNWYCGMRSNTLHYPMFSTLLFIRPFLTRQYDGYLEKARDKS